MPKTYADPLSAISFAAHKHRAQRRKTEQARVEQALGHLTPKQRRSILWGMRRNPSGWSNTHTEAMHWLQRAKLKTARAWWLKMAGRRCARCSPTRAATTTRSWPAPS